jgi:hypothetical protein
MRRMNSSGFWLRCTVAFFPGLWIRGAERFPFPLNRSVPASGGCDQTFVTAWSCVHG